MLCKRNDDVTYYTLFIACIAAREKINMPWAGPSIDAAKVWICRWLVQRKGHIVGSLLVWQRHLEMQAKFFPGTALHQCC